MKDFIAEIVEHNSKLTRQDVLDATTQEQDWEEGGRVHNWKNYVPDFVQNRWLTLPLEARAIVYSMAQDQASNEEWD